MTPFKIVGVFATAVLLLCIGFTAGRQLQPKTAGAPTVTPIVGRSDGDIGLMVDMPMTPLEESTTGTSKDAVAKKAGAKAPDVAEILNRSRGYRGSGGGFDVQLLWHAQSRKEIIVWADEMGIYPFKQSPAKDPEVLILRSTEGSGVTTQQTLYFFIRLSNNEWELRGMSVIVGDSEVVMSYDTSKYTAYAKSRSGELLSVISFVGYQPTSREQAERRERDKAVMKGIEVR